MHNSPLDPRVRIGHVHLKVADLDYDGMITDYVYDEWKNVIRVSKGYRNDDTYSGSITSKVSDMIYERDFLGRVTATKRSVGGTEATLESVVYDLAGKIFSRQDALGNTTYYRTNYGIGKVVYTSHPASGSPSLHRTEEETYNADGRLARRRVYASSQRCDSVESPALYGSVSGDIANHVLENKSFTYAFDGTHWAETVASQGKAGSSTAERTASYVDALGRVALIYRTNAASAFVPVQTNLYSTATGPSKGKLITRTLPGNQRFFYQYDARGRRYRTFASLDASTVPNIYTADVSETIMSVDSANAAYKNVHNVYPFDGLYGPPLVASKINDT